MPRSEPLKGKLIVQITVTDIPNFDQEVWFDVMDLDGTGINDLAAVRDLIGGGLTTRKTRIIQVLEDGE